MTRAVRAGWCAAFILAALAGCGGGGKARTTAPKGPPALVDLVPDDAALLVRVDLALFRASPHFGALRDILTGELTASPVLGKVVDRTEEAVIAATPSGGRDAEATALLLLRGRFTSEDVAAFQRERDDAAEAPPAKPFSDEGVSGFRWADGTRTFLLSPTVWITVDERWFARTLHAARHPDERAPLDALKSLRGHAVDFALDLSRADAAALAERRARVTGPLRGLARATAVRGHADFSAGLSVAGEFRMKDDRQAKSVAGELQRVRDHYRGNMMLRALGLAKLLDGAEVRAAGADVTASLRVDEADFRELLERASSLLGAAVGAMQAGDGGLSL